MQAIFESAFDIVYLFTILTLGILMIKRSEKASLSRLFGIMAIVLGAGDAFHLLPRIYGLLVIGLESNTVALGIGKLVTSITMTAFYLILYYVWRKRYHIVGKKGLTIVLWTLALIKIIISLSPHNQWLIADSSYAWGLYRNIPFTLFGLIMIFLFFRSAKISKDKTFRYMWLAITLSFAFYMPVILFARIFPLVGMLMIPKTICYVWVVIMGYKTLKE